MPPCGLPLLQQQRVTTATLARYQTVVVAFLTWVARAHGPLISLAALDGALLAYAHTGQVGRGTFTTLVSAVLFFMPSLDPLRGVRPCA